MTNEQRIAISKCADRLESLDHEVRRLGDKAESLGELRDDQLGDVSYSGLVFNMGRAWDAAVVAIGEFNGEPKLKVFMTDPAEIINRCKYLIEAAESFVLEARLVLNESATA